MRWLISGVLVLTIWVALASKGPAADSVDPIVGSYTWHDNATVLIRANGTTKLGDNQVGKWVTNPFSKAGTGGYVIMWKGGYVERVHLGPRGKQLHGTGLDPDGKTYTVTGNRK